MHLPASAIKSFKISQSSTNSSPLILIVEDEFASWLILQSLLESSGYDTIRASDLATAREMLANHAISLVLLDVNLPDGNGIDWCTELNTGSAFSSIPVIFVTATYTSQEKVRGFSAGAVDYITKPYDKIEVLARVRTHLRLKAAYDSLQQLQDERLKKLGRSQQLLMPLPSALVGAKFAVIIDQKHTAGGDFYDVKQSGTHIWDYLIADASGHDVDSSLWTASLKTLFHEYSTIVNTPEEIVRMINRSLLTILPPAQYFTIIMARINRKNNTLTLVNAGHPAAILLQTPGFAEPIEQEGDMLGMFNDAMFNAVSHKVKQGDRLFLYTDGMIEGSNNWRRGLQNLIGTISNLSEPDLESAVNKIRSQMLESGDISNDDTIIMAIEV
jgi:phosphoserine phosphatase RsbU/P